MVQEYRKSRHERTNIHRSVSPVNPDVTARIYQHVRAKSYNFMAQQEEPEITQFEACNPKKGQFQTLKTAQIFSKKLDKNP